MPTYASEAEILTAFEALTPVEIAKLGLHAKSLMRSQSRSPYTETEDLISEALHRALDGRRQWPVGVVFMAFMCETMRSVINHDTDNLDNKPGAHVAFDDVLVEAQQWSYGLHAPSAEQECLAAERKLARLTALNAADSALAAEGDVLARKVLRGMIKELSTSELIKKTNASPNELAAARRRVQRRLNDAKAESKTMH